MKLTRMLALLSRAFAVALPFWQASAEGTICFDLNITLENTLADTDVVVSFQATQGQSIGGPFLGPVGPIPGGETRTFKLSGSWDRVPDSQMIISDPTGAEQVYAKYTIYMCDTDEPKVDAPFTLPGLPTNTLQGFIMPPDPAAEEPSFELWVVDADGNGQKALDLTPAQLAELPELPETNQLIASGEGYAFYVLTTGEFQVNYGPTTDGWYDVVVFNRDFEVTNTYRTR
jgi:hypothetical protein